MELEFKHEPQGNGGVITLFENSAKAGEISYVWAGDDKIIIDHTETFEGYAGKGYGRMLVEQTVAFAEGKGVKIVPVCSYAKRVLSGDNRYREIVY